jgi:uncharacterized protein
MQTSNSKTVLPYTSDERMYAMLAHGSAILNLFTVIGGAIAAFVIWLTQKDKSAWAAYHALQSLIFQIVVPVVTVLVVAVIWVVGFLVSFATAGIGTFVAVPVMILAFFGAFLVVGGSVVYSIYGAIQVYHGREFHYILIGNWVHPQTLAA